MARDEDLSLAVLQGAGPSQVGFYPPSVLGRWPRSPRSRTSVTLGIRWSVSAAEKDGESGGLFPTLRHAHLLGLIGRSHSESEERRRLDWDRGSTIFTSSAKRKAESPRVAERSFIYNRKNNGPMTEP